jgi:hypothetical protein
MHEVSGSRKMHYKRLFTCWHLNLLQIIIIHIYLSHVTWVVTTTWCIVRLQMEETASRYGRWLQICWISSHGQGMVLQLGGWAWGKLLTLKNKLVTQCHNGPRTWTDSLDKRAKLKKMDVRFRMWNERSLYRAVYLIIVAKEISKYKLVGVQEVRWEYSVLCWNLK